MNLSIELLAYAITNNITKASHLAKLFAQEYANSYYFKSEYQDLSFALADINDTITSNCLMDLINIRRILLATNDMDLILDIFFETLIYNAEELELFDKSDDLALFVMDYLAKEISKAIKQHKKPIRVLNALLEAVLDDNLLCDFLLDLYYKHIYLLSDESLEQMYRMQFANCTYKAKTLLLDSCFLNSAVRQERLKQELFNLLQAS